MTEESKMETGDHYKNAFFTEIHLGHKVKCITLIRRLKISK
jgi:hypothetical protein